MTTALISTAGALLGVIVGGVLNWVVQRQGEDRREARLAHAGSRLVARDLRAADESLEATKEDSWVWRRTRRLDTGAWDTYREALAIRLSTDQWDAVADAVEAVRALDARLQAILGAGSTTDRLPSALQERIADARTTIERALASLVDFTAQGEPARRSPTTTE